MDLSNLDALRPTARAQPRPLRRPSAPAGAAPAEAKASRERTVAAVKAGDIGAFIPLNRPGKPVRLG